jgi:hypothetical protein
MRPTVLFFRAGTRNQPRPRSLLRDHNSEQEVEPCSPSFRLTTSASWPPVFASKDNTDRCYDAAIVELVRAVAGSADGRARFSLPTTQGAAPKFLDTLVSVGLATHE